MNALSTLPTIKAAELVDRAGRFAKQMVEELEAFNRKHPQPELSQEAAESLDKKFGETIPGPAPSDFGGLFQVIFCHYMASRRVVIP